jgi:hypothetical protein
MSKNDNKPSKSDLFAGYRAFAADRKAAEDAIAAVRKDESEIIAQIVQHYGPGPYKLDGTLVRARKAKAELGGLYSFHTQTLEAEEV